MIAKEYRDKKIEELEKLEAELSQRISDAYFELRTGKSKDIRMPRRLRKELSVLKTVICEKKKNGSQT